MSDLLRGPASRPQVSQELLDALHDHYGIRGGETATDIGGSSNLNLLITHDAQRYVLRVYRSWVTVKRLKDIQRVRQHLSLGGVPCALPLTTLTGESWIALGNHVIEVEPYMEHDGNMDSWIRLELGMPLLGRIHMLLRELEVSEDGRNAPAANNIDPLDVLHGTLSGTHRIRQWGASPSELQLANDSEELAQLVYHAQHGVQKLPRQLVHGDYWDNNVFFHDNRIVLVADLDFMGERARIDDIALTLYYTNSTFSEDQLSDQRIRMLRSLVDAYDAGEDQQLTTAERAALPIALARTALTFIAMIAVIDSEIGARQMAANMRGDISWALAIMHDLDRWQRGFARQS